MSGLDDFFAKKDKKKNKKKGFSKANTDVIAKTLEEQDRKEQREEEQKTSKNLATTEANRAGAAAAQGAEEKNEDEWKLFEDEKKDYSNLKIDTLKVSSDNEQDDDDHEINEEGEKVPKKDPGGPWSKMHPTGSANADSSSDKGAGSPEAPRRAPEAPDLVTPKGAIVGGSYVPPHMRGAGASAGAERSIAPTRGGPTRKPKHAPAIDSQVHFPSLSADSGPNARSESDGNSAHFEEVRTGGPGRTQAAEVKKIALDNKFSALRG